MRCCRRSVAGLRRAFERKQQLPHVHDLAFLRMKLGDLALERGRNLDRRLVGHDFSQRLVERDLFAWLDSPFREFAFVYAFTELWKLELHGAVPLSSES